MKGPKSGLIQLAKISVRKDIAINLPDTIFNSIDGMEADHIVRTMVEFGSKAFKLILLNYSNFSIAKIVVKKIERVK